MFLIRVDDRYVIFGLNKGIEILQIFRVRITDAVSPRNYVISRIGEITERSPAENPRPFDPAVQARIGKVSRRPDGRCGQFFAVGQLVVFQSGRRGGVQEVQPSVVGNVERAVDSHAEISVVDIVLADALRRTDKPKSFRRTFGTVDIVSPPRPRLAQIKISVVINDLGRVCAVRRLFVFGDGKPAVSPVHQIVRLEHLDSVARIGGGWIQIVFSVEAHHERIADSILTVSTRRRARAPLPVDFDMVFVPLDFGRQIFRFLAPPVLAGGQRKRRQHTHCYNHCFLFHARFFLYGLRNFPQPVKRGNQPLILRFLKIAAAPSV